MALVKRELDGSQLAAVARLFSASVIKELSKTSHSPLFTRLAEDADLFEQFSPTETVGRVFDRAFSVLRKKNNRHEYVYKAALTHKVLLGIHSLKTASMITEFRVGECKADAVILNGTGTVYEIKSERDSLDRLEKQIATYRRVFAKVNVITGRNHVKGVLANVPGDVGVMVLSDRHQITTEREAVDCPERTNPEALLECIQLAEAKKILARLQIEIPTAPNTQIRRELHDIFKVLDPVETHHAMVSVLKQTRSLAPLESFVETLPKSLLAASFSTKINKADRLNLIKAVRTPVIDARKWNYTPLTPKPESSGMK